MRAKTYFAIVAIAGVCLTALGAWAAQPRISPNGPTVTAPQVIKVSGTLRDLAGQPITGPVEVTFSIYSSQEGGSPLWYETQTVEADSLGHYTALVGTMTPTGVPMSLFTTGEARWLGVMVRGLPEEPRVELVSVPYAMEASNAESLGGKPASDYLLAGEASSATTILAGVGGGSGTTASASPGQRSSRSLAKSSTKLPRVTGSGVAGYVPLWNSSSSLTDSNIFQNSTTGEVGIGTVTPGATLDVEGPPAPTSGPAENGLKVVAQAGCSGSSCSSGDLNGGGINLTGGAGGSRPITGGIQVGHGGGISLAGGNGGISGGGISLTGGNGGAGGSINLTGGNSAGLPGGSITLQPGFGSLFGEILLAPSGGEVAIGTRTLTLGEELVVNGSVYVIGTVTQASSRRFKKDIHTLHDGLGLVERLRGVTYRQKSNNQAQVGVIAEEVAKVLPQVVAYGPHGHPLGVDYSRLTAVLIQAAKEQQEEIATQRQEIWKQQQEIHHLAQLQKQQARMLAVVERLEHQQRHATTRLARLRF